jgi:RNA polymerase sigma-70 factor (ECF subfamily)
VPDRPEDFGRLIAGDKSAWDTFVARFAGLISAAVRRVVGSEGEIDDVAQDVFLRLCKDDFRLLRQFDPARAGITTWLTIIARSAAHDSLRRRRLAQQTLDETPESALAVYPIMPETVKIPPGLLSPRQQLVLTMLYDREMEVAEIADALAVDAQTVRSTHHKALLKLRAHFGNDA